MASGSAACTLALNRLVCEGRLFVRFSCRFCSSVLRQRANFSRFALQWAFLQFLRRQRVVFTRALGASASASALPLNETALSPTRRSMGMAAQAHPRRRDAMLSLIEC